jgi:hypothetical protein
MKNVIIGLAAVLGVGLAANGVFMLASPMAWYLAAPGVTSTGAFNQHFLRDIGLIFLLIGALLTVGAARPALRVPFWGLAAVWLSGHALFHFWEVAVGICGPSALARDFPVVTLPAIITLSLTLWAAMARRAAGATDRP